MKQIKLSEDQIKLFKEALKNQKEVEKAANEIVGRFNEANQRTNELIQMFCLTVGFEPAKTTMNLDEGIAIENEPEVKPKGD